MDLTDKKYPNYINLAQMIAIMDMYIILVQISGIKNSGD